MAVAIFPIALVIGLGISQLYTTKTHKNGKIYLDEFSGYCLHKIIKKKYAQLPRQHVEQVSTKNDSFDSALFQSEDIIKFIIKKTIWTNFTLRTHVCQDCRLKEPRKPKKFDFSRQLPLTARTREIGICMD